MSSRSAASSTGAAASLCARPGVALGAFPEQPERQAPLAERVSLWVRGRIAVPRGVGRRAVGRFAAEVDAQAAGLAELDDVAFDRKLAALRSELRRSGVVPALLPRAFALVREAAARTLGTPHYDVQLYGGRVMALGGLAELETGEGKTLTATLPASVAALAGIPVHVITANDYLVARDAESMRPLYERLGIRTGIVVEEEPDRAARREAYACDVTYVTNKQVAFDYLQDRLALGDSGRLSRRLLRNRSGEAPLCVLRGLCFAIVDEADSVLIDDARTPLILSRGGAPPDAETRETVSRALELARSLEAGRDYEVDRARGQVEVTGHGHRQLAERAESLDGPLGGERQRSEWVGRALSALHLFDRETHYLVADGEIHIIDQPTGRRSPDRSFEGGMQSLIEAKEGVELTAQRETIARISYQRFFRRYLALSGMTGTACEVSQELWNVYRLATWRVPTRLASQRADHGAHVLALAEERLDRVTARIRELNRAGRPVLVGTPDVAASEELSAHLDRAGLAHRVLNARQDADEAALVATAGEAGRITVATRMAGRGTDIPLGAGVAEAGGLAVVATELAEARRIDRQLFGRSARQGTAGSFEQWVSLEDRLVAGRLPGWLLGGLRQLLAWALPTSRTRGVQSMLFTVTRWAQSAEEKRSARARARLLSSERAMEDLLAFTGRTDR